MLEHLINRLAREEDGQTMAEYAVVLAVITVAVLATLGVLSGNIDAALQAVSDAIGG
jgi:Flp pilus assembly pilin Flp